MPNHKAGICLGWRPSRIWDGDGCYVCWKEKNPKTRRQHRARNVAPFRAFIDQKPKQLTTQTPEPRPPCLFLGPLLIEKPCTDGGKPKHIYACECEYHEATRCTLQRNCGKDKDIAACAGCKQYLSQETLDDIQGPWKQRDSATWVRRQEVQNAHYHLAILAMKNLPPCPEFPE